MRPRFGGGSTMHEKSKPAFSGFFVSGTKGAAVAADAKRFTTGGATGGQLPHAPLPEDPGVGGGG